MYLRQYRLFVFKEMSSRLTSGDNENIEVLLTQVNDAKGVMVSYMDKWKDIENDEISDGHVTYYEDRADELEDAVSVYYTSSTKTHTYTHARAHMYNILYFIKHSKILWSMLRTSYNMPLG